MYFDTELRLRWVGMSFTCYVPHWEFYFSSDVEDSILHVTWGVGIFMGSFWVRWDRGENSEGRKL